MSRSSQNPKPVAVVGISAEFPSGTLSETNFDHQSFFDFLLSGKDASERVPADRFNIDGWQGSHLGQVLPEEAAFLKNDVITMGVATRKLVEHAFLALLDSGINSRSQNVGAYTSGIAFDLLSAADADEFDTRDGLGEAQRPSPIEFHITWISWDRPSPSTLPALRAGDCEAAVIGGSQINHRFLDWVYYSQLSILSPGGKSIPFDASADGFGRGEAVVVLVIKLLEDAIRDGDKIYATVLNTAVNSTGSAGPMKTPIADSQAAAMLTAYQGIGRTAVGDPVEANWVGHHFKRDSELLIGSIKGNIGHTEITSFLASFSKVCSMFATNKIPPQANYKSPNPAIHWDEYNMRVATQAEEFKTRNASGKRLVSINAFGLLGANGHVIAESPPEKVSYSAYFALPHINLSYIKRGCPWLLVAAGLSPRSATAIAADLAKLAQEIPEELPVLSNIYGRRARQLTWRTAAISTADRSFVFPAPRFVSRGAPPLVFVFSGQGPQHIETLQDVPCFQGQHPSDGQSSCRGSRTSIVHELGFFGDTRPKDALPDTWPVTLTVPSIAMIQMALVDLFAAFGIRPNVVFGHSAGEAAMSYASGALPQELAMEIAIRRSRAMTVVEGSGGMAAVSCIPSVAREIIRSVLQEAGPGDVLELGCYNAPEAVTISGTQTMLDKAVAIAQKREMFARQIKARVPGHCSLLEPCKARYVEEMEIAFSTGSRWEKEFTPEYMWNNGRVPVQFEQTVTAVVAEMPEAIFIEIGPHPALSSYISGMGAKPDKVLCPMRRAKPVKKKVNSLNSNAEFNEITDLLTCVGHLSSLGVNAIDFNAVNATDALEISKPLPAYPFAPKPIPFYSENSRMAVKQKRSRKGPLNYESLAMNALTHPDLAEHVIKGKPILPATGFFEMMFEEGARTIWDIELRSLLPLLPEKVLEVEVKSDGHAWSIISSQGSGRNPRLHATGFMTAEVMDKDLGPIDLASIRARYLYAVLNSTAEFGPLYRRIEACFEGDHEILFRVRGNAPELTEHHNYVFHPSVLDSCIHGLLHPVFTGNADPSVYYLPSHIGRVILYDRAVEKGIPETLYSHVVPHGWTPESLTCDAFIVDEQGERLVTLMNCVISKHWTGEVPTRPNTSYETIYQPLGMPAAEFTLPRLKQQDYAFLDAMVPSSNDKASDAQTDGYVNGHINGYTNGSLVGEHHEIFQGITESLSSEEPELKPSSILKLFSSSLDVCVAAIRQIFEHAVKSGKQVFRLLDIGDTTGSLYQLLTGIASEYPTLRLDYTACGHEHTSIELRTASFDVDAVSKQAGLSPNTYDAVIETHMLGFAAEVEKSLESLNSLLVPGGFLVALEANGSPYTPGGKWVDHVFSPQGRWPGLRSGKQYRRWSQSEWNGQVAQANFRPVEVPQSSLFLMLLAQKPSLPLIPLSSPESSSDADQPIIFSFEPSLALDLQNVILGSMSSGVPSKIWIEATMGTFNGAAATGFARSLMRELVAVEIRLVLFDSVWKPESRVAAIRRLSGLSSLEPEIALDASGVALVPRYCARALLTPEILDHNKYWAVQHPNTVTQSAPPLPGPHQVLVQVSFLSEEEGGLQGLVGTVTRSHSSQWQVGARVVAVGQISEVPENADERSCTSIALLLVFAALGLNLDSRPLSSLQQIQVVVLHNSKFASFVARVLEYLGVTPILIAPSLPLILPRLSPGDIIMCGLPATSADTIPQPEGVSVFNWNDRALPAVARNPWLVSTALNAHLTRALCKVSLDSDPLTPEQLLPSHFEVSRSLALVDDKFYLVVGGIGSLGLQIAIWLYRVQRVPADLRALRTERCAALPSTLQSLPDLDLRLEACDATSVEDLTKLISSLDCPLAGCIFSAVVLADRLFLKQDPENFMIPYKSKTDAYFALEKVVALEKLDFVLGISSVASFGAAGQTNYASANTGLEYLTSRYSNAWSIVVPAIADSFVGFDMFTSANSHMETWKTSIMNSYGNDSPLFNHLVKLDTTQDKLEVEDPSQVLQEIVLKFIDAAEDEFERNVPLTSYGLDSLSAARMSTALKPYMAITQIQLLGDLSLDDLVSKMGDAKPVVMVEESVSSSTEQPFAWDAFNQPGQSLLKLIIGSGIPLIMIHGGAGDISAFRAIQEQFTTPLWAIQPTPDSPLDTVDTLAQFYLEKIKEARPTGPYRIGGFSGSSMITLRLVQLLEANGDEILQLSFVDHFPMLFTSPIHGLTEAFSTIEDLFTYGLKATVDMIADCCSRDASPARRAHGDNLIAAWKGLPTTVNALRTWEWTQKFTPINMKQMVEFAGGKAVWASTDAATRQAAMRRSIVDQLAKVRAPITVLIANRGLSALLPAEWEDLGVSLSKTGRPDGVL
ncbi:polyketide synthase [Mycena olivaceomarginata]|nr:polyketide synthase [Mycena olivaceomarginata]